MLIRARFGKWIVVACMAALAACTSKGDGTVGSNELNVIFPNGTTGDFEIGRVTVDVQCTGATNDFFGVDPADATVFTTDLEFDNTPVTGGAEVYHAFMDLLGDCLFDVRAFEPDGELFCVGQGFTNVQPGDTQQVNVTLMCDVSQNIDTGNADFIINNTIIMVGNFCPFVHSLETIPDDIPIVPNPLEIPNPNLPTPNSTEFQLCALDAADASLATATISSCGNRCDVSPDPGNLSFTCTATLPDGTPSQGTFSDPTNGGAGQDFDGDPTTYNGWCSNLLLAGSGITLPPSVGYFTCSDQEPGVTVTISCTGGDGDEDCDKTKSALVTCAGTNLCVPLPPECNDPDTTDCVGKGPCNPSDGTCQDVLLDGGEACQGNPGPGPGVCSAGSCVDAGLCDGPPPVVCDDDAQDCINGGICDPATGSCPAPIDLDGVACDTPASGPGICSAGTCIGNCTGVVCDADPNDCIDGGTCNPADGSCPAPVNQPQGTPCDLTGTLDGVCDNAGTCVAGGPPTYDLSASIFKPYNSLLPALTGTGDPATDCAVPDLSLNTGANLTGITANCLILGSPDISGSMTFEDTGGGTFNVTGVQDLLFTIDVFIVFVNAQVIINTNSSTAFSGTATGSLPGTLTMDDLGGGFNVNGAATGNVNCQAFNNVGVGNACTCADGSGACADCPNFALGQTCTGGTCDITDVSVGVCPLAFLQGGDNSVPLPNDPGQRTFPPITVTDADFQLGGGIGATNGWYLVNPAPLAGNGTQWAALGGVRQ